MSYELGFLIVLSVIALVGLVFVGLIIWSVFSSRLTDDEIEEIFLDDEDSQELKEFRRLEAEKQAEDRKKEQTKENKKLLKEYYWIDEDVLETPQGRLFFGEIIGVEKQDEPRFIVSSYYPFETELSYINHYLVIKDVVEGIGERTVNIECDNRELLDMVYEKLFNAEEE